MIDEDETLELVSFGGDVQEMRVGLDLAESKARAAYVAGEIEVDEFEAEIERLLRKRAAPPT